MLGNLKEFFKGEAATLNVNKGGDPTSKDLQVATGVLLLEMAGADQDYAPEEVRAIFATMEQQFGITDSEIMEIMEDADKVRKEEGKFDEFVKIINENFNENQKLLILAMIWKVILADELIEKYEQRFAAEIRQRLQLSREQAEDAKQIALEGKV